MSESVRVSEKKSEAAKEDRTSHAQKSNYSESVNLSADRILFLQRTIGNQAVGRLIKYGALQAKLRIGQPDDIYEQEADRVAEQVMRMSEPQIAQSNNFHIQRACPKSEENELKRQAIKEEDEEEKLQKQPIDGRKKFKCGFYAGDSKLEDCLNDKDRLRPSDTGPSVIKIQKGLKADEEYMGEISGIYDAATGQAVMAFKKHQKLGYEKFPDVGPGTTSCLDKLCLTKGKCNKDTIPPVKVPPTICTTPAELEFEAEKGTSDNPTKQLEIRNCGQGTIAWEAKIRNRSLVPWLSLDRFSGTIGSNSVTVKTSTDDLLIGDYNASIIISASADNSPKRVPVNLHVIERRSGARVPPDKKGPTTYFEDQGIWASGGVPQNVTAESSGKFMRFQLRNMGPGPVSINIKSNHDGDQDRFLVTGDSARVEFVNRIGGHLNWSFMVTIFETIQTDKGGLSALIQWSLYSIWEE